MKMLLAAIAVALLFTACATDVRYHDDGYYCSGQYDHYGCHDGGR